MFSNNSCKFLSATLSLFIAIGVISVKADAPPEEEILETEKKPIRVIRSNHYDQTTGKHIIGEVTNLSVNSICYKINDKISCVPKE